MDVKIMYEQLDPIKKIPKMVWINKVIKILDNKSIGNTFLVSKEWCKLREHPLLENVAKREIMPFYHAISNNYLSFLKFYMVLANINRFYLYLKCKDKSGLIFVSNLISFVEKIVLLFPIIIWSCLYVKDWKFTFFLIHNMLYITFDLKLCKFFYGVLFFQSLFISTKVCTHSFGYFIPIIFIMYHITYCTAWNSTVKCISKYHAYLPIDRSKKGISYIYILIICFSIINQTRFQSEILALLLFEIFIMLYYTNCIYKISMGWIYMIIFAMSLFYFVFSTLYSVYFANVMFLKFHNIILTLIICVGFDYKNELYDPFPGFSLSSLLECILDSFFIRFHAFVSILVAFVLVNY